jgi:hypothetical protein
MEALTIVSRTNSRRAERLYGPLHHLRLIAFYRYDHILGHHSKSSGGRSVPSGASFAWRVPNFC